MSMRWQAKPAGLPVGCTPVTSSSPTLPALRRRGFRFSPGFAFGSSYGLRLRTNPLTEDEDTGG